MLQDSDCENSYGRRQSIRLRACLYFAGDDQPTRVPGKGAQLASHGEHFQRPGSVNSFAISPEYPMHHRPLKGYVFYCSNHVEAHQLSILGHRPGGDAIKCVSLPCSGKVDLPYLMKAFETGAEGVAIVTCKRNECRHFEGNLRAHKRAEDVESLLEEIGIAAGRMAVFECGEQDIEAVLGEIQQFMERVKNLPPIHASGGHADQPRAHQHES